MAAFGTALLAMLVFFIVEAPVVFRVATRDTPSPRKNEIRRDAAARLWRNYKDRQRRVLGSPWLWAAAAAWTALWLAVYFNS